MKYSIKLIILIGLLFSLHSCTQENNVDNPDNLEAPSIPPTSLFEIPTQDFGLVDDKGSSSTRSMSNWIHAGLSVIHWNTVVFVHTVVPTTAFGKAFDYEPEYIGNYTFEWKYPYTSNPANGSKTYEVSLTGQYIMEQKEVVWTMTVTEEGTLNEFIWYEGVVATNHTYGNFTINKDPQSPQPYMTIEFNADVANDEVSIKFTNVIAGDEGNGDYIEWKKMNNNVLDRSYNVFNKNSLLEIEINETTKIGRVKHPSHFGDNEWHCWDAAKQDADC